MDAKAGADGPSTTAVRDLLSGIIEIAKRYAPAEAVAAVGEPAGEAAVGEAAGADLAEAWPLPARRHRRVRSPRARTRCACSARSPSIFRRTEPHSPISYTLDEAVRRGRLTWPELLDEVVADMNTRNSILTMLGIRPPPPPA